MIHNILYVSFYLINFIFIVVYQIILTIISIKRLYCYKYNNILYCYKHNISSELLEDIKEKY